MSKFTSIVSRRRKPEEVPTLRVAVRNFCLECVGYLGMEVGACTDTACWLYPWRSGKTPKVLKSSRLGNQHAFAALRSQTEENAVESTQRAGGVLLVGSTLKGAQDAI